LPTKVHVVKAMTFPVVMYGYESWTIKKAEYQRTGAFELRCWRRLLRSPWAGGRSIQSVLKEINPEYSLEGLMLKLKLQYFDHLMWKANSLEKILMLGKIECKRTRGQQRMRWLDSILDSMGMNLSKLQNIVKDGGIWHAAVHGVAKSWTQLSDWTTKEAFWVIWWTTLLEPRPYPLGKKQSHLNIGRRNVTVGQKKAECQRIDASNFSTGYDSWKSLGQQEEQTNQS